MLVNPHKLRSFTKYSSGMFKTKSWGGFNGDTDLWGGNDADRSYPEFPVDPEFNAYGVCDTPDQFREKYGEMLSSDPRPLVTMFTHVEKEPQHRGEGGGWRWHKWGPYVGIGTPTTEYLDDEEEFPNGIYVYHVYLVDNLTFSTEMEEAK